MIKRLLFFGLVALAVYTAVYRDEEVFYKSVGRGEVTYYTRYAAGEVPSAEVIPNGGGSLVRCGYADYKKVRAALREISGVSIRFTGGQRDVEAAIEALEIKAVIAESLDEEGIVSYYGFTFKLKNRIKADNKFINVQIAKKGDTITIGYPIILGSY